MANLFKLYEVVKTFYVATDLKDEFRIEILDEQNPGATYGARFSMKPFSEDAVIDEFGNESYTAAWQTLEGVSSKNYPTIKEAIEEADTELREYLKDTYAYEAK